MSFGAWYLDGMVEIRDKYVFFFKKNIVNFDFSSLERMFLSF